MIFQNFYSSSSHYRHVSFVTIVFSHPSLKSGSFRVFLNKVKKLNDDTQLQLPPGHPWAMCST